MAYYVSHVRYNIRHHYMYISYVEATYVDIQAGHKLYISYVKRTVIAIYGTFLAWSIDGLYCRLQMAHAQLMYSLNVTICSLSIYIAKYINLVTGIICNVYRGVQCAVAMCVAGPCGARLDL